LEAIKQFYVKAKLMKAYMGFKNSAWCRKPNKNKKRFSIKKSVFLLLKLGSNQRPSD